MKLFASILTTAAITGAVWGLVVHQPAMADTTKNNQLPQLEVPQLKVTKASANASSDEKQKEVSQQYLDGVTKTLPLESVGTLWGDFERMIVEQNKLHANWDTIIVLYQNLNSDFTEATVTIGFPSTGNSATDNSATNNLVALPEIEIAQPLLKRGKYSESELIDAWQQINFQRQVDALVEIHYLNQQGEPESSQLSVYYK